MRCGFTFTIKRKRMNDTGTELLKLGIIGIGGALTPNPAACLEGASGNSSSNSASNITSSYQQKSAAPKASISSNNCSSDFSCPRGQKCVKAPYRSQGKCMTSVNKFGREIWTHRSTSSWGVRTRKIVCRYTTDCPIGFKCDRTCKVCTR